LVEVGAAREGARGEQQNHWGRDLPDMRYTDMMGVFVTVMIIITKIQWFSTKKQ
jgi:hypothetical protein